MTSPRLAVLLATAFAVGIIAGALAHARPAKPPSGSNPLAVLIVGDETSKALRQREEEVIQLIRQSMAEQGLPKEMLPILVYHLNKPAERAYCEKKLKITKKDLLFLGLAEHKNLVVSKVVLRESHVQNSQQAVISLFQRAVAVITGLPPTEVPVTTPSPTETSEPGGEPSPDDSGVSVDHAVMCRSVDGRGAPRDRTDVFDPEDSFYVSMECFGLQIGTRVETVWYQGKKVIHRARLLSDKMGDYYAWFSVSPGAIWAPGRYRVSVSVNGAYKTSVYFRVSESQ